MQLCLQPWVARTTLCRATLHLIQYRSAMSLGQASSTFSKLVNSSPKMTMQMHTCSGSTRPCCRHCLTRLTIPAKNQSSQQAALTRTLCGPCALSGTPQEKPQSGWSSRRLQLDGAVAIYPAGTESQHGCCHAKAELALGGPLTSLADQREPTGSLAAQHRERDTTRQEQPAEKQTRPTKMHGEHRQRRGQRPRHGGLPVKNAVVPSTSRRALSAIIGFTSAELPR